MKIQCKWSAKWRDAEFDAVLVGGTYGNGRKALEVMEAGNDFDTSWPWCVASVNLPDSECPENEMFVKDYSENTGTVENLIRLGIIESEPTATVESGWVTIGRYRLTEKGLSLWD